MRVIEKEVFKYSELDDRAKEKVRDWFCNGDYHWIDEGVDSVRAFCKHYGVDLVNYSLCPWSPSDIETNAENKHFRGVTLKQVEKERGLMPTGYCVDCDLFETMYESMKENNGNPLEAFNDAIDAGMKSILADMEWQESEEYISELLEINDYEFYGDGSKA